MGRVPVIVRDILMRTPISSKERQRIIRQKVNMKRYLVVLSALVGRSVLGYELESLEKTDELEKTVGEVVRPTKNYTFEIPFAERLSKRFIDFIDGLYQANSSSVYVWLKRAWDCGIFVAPSISSIKFDFEFDIYSNGIFVFLSKDMNDQLKLDFYLLETGEQSLICDVKGPNWGRVKY